MGIDVPLTALTRKVGFVEDFKGDDRWKISPTQVRAHQECPRKWGFRYLDGIQTPQTKAAALGSAVHSVLEGYLNAVGDAVLDLTTREAKIARAGLAYLPPPGTAALVEKEILFDWDGLLFRGFIDAAWEPEDGPPVVSDHKTSSDPRKWGLTAAELPTDVQGLIYGTWGLDHWGEAVLDLQWTYFATRGAPKAFPVSARITREETRAKFKERVEPTGRAIVRAVEAHKADGLMAQGMDANPAACGMYGGCGYAGICVRTQEETITAIFGQSKSKDKDKTMGLKELLAKKKGKKAPPRVEELENVVSINPPEAPATDEVAREVSQAVGGATGNAAKKKAKGREIATAAAGETDPQAARAKADAALAKAEAVTAPTKVPSPTQAQILAWVTSGAHHVFAANRPKATAERPFAHGRTLGAMQREGLINVRADFPEPGFRTVMPTDAGREAAPPSTETAPPEPEAPKAKVERTPPPGAVERVVEALTSPEHEHPGTRSATRFDDEVLVEFAPEARLFADLLLKTLDVEKAEALMAAFERRFQ